MQTRSVQKSAVFFLMIVCVFFAGIALAGGDAAGAPTDDFYVEADFGLEIDPTG